MLRVTVTVTTEAMGARMETHRSQMDISAEELHQLVGAIQRAENKISIERAKREAAEDGQKTL